MENAYYKNVDPTYRLWSLTNVPMLTKYTFCLNDEKKALVEDVVSAFKKRVVIKYDQLPKGKGLEYSVLGSFRGSYG